MHGVMGSSGLCGAVGISEVSMEQSGAMGVLWGVYGAGGGFMRLSMGSMGPWGVKDDSMGSMGDLWGSVGLWGAYRGSMGCLQGSVFYGGNGVAMGCQ